jgi:Sugar-transfer associated ATP-grasp
MSAAIAPLMVPAKRSWTGRVGRLWRQHLPDGMISWRFLFPGGDPCIRQHRDLRLAARGPHVPRLVWSSVQWLLWLRWLVWHAWRDSWRAVRRYGPEVARRDACGLARQFAVALGLALAHTVPPLDTYAYRLYRHERKRRMWTYVFDHETDAFHAWDCESPQDWQAGAALLVDKLETGRRLEALGLPTVETLQVIPRGGSADFRIGPDHHPRLFCKTRRGARGEGAFVVEPGRAGSAICLRDFAHPKPAIEDVAAFLAKRLALDDFLIQPCLPNHPDIDDLTELDLAITVRLISLRRFAAAAVTSAEVHVPVSRPDGDRDTLLLAVALDDGSLAPVPEAEVHTGCRRALADLHGRLGGRRLPDWRAACRIALAAHEHLCPGMHRVAWDFVMTPQGPTLLEGNSGWGVYSVQVIGGGLLTPPVKAPTTV